MALVMALGILLVLTITLTTVITFTAAGARDSHRVNAGQKAYALAEAGVNNALAVLNQNYPCTACYPGNPALLPARTTAYSTGSVSWSGTLQAAPLGFDWSDEWRLTATSTVPNPTGPAAAPITRKVTAVVPIIIPAASSIGDENPLNYIYAKSDVTFEQSVIVASPVYATSDLHLENQATISEFIGNVPGIKNRMAVGGVFYADQNANKAGHVLGTGNPANNLEKAYVVGGCNTKQYDNNATTHPCVFGSGSPIDQIWGDATGNFIPVGFIDYIPELTCCAPYPNNASLTPTAIPPADSNMGRAYKTADIGPRSPCTTGSVPFTFDGVGGPDNLINNSATPTGTPAINLTPASTYSCKSARGELSWNGSILRVQGTVFIDGSATITSARNQQAKVTGQGALFLTGTFMMKNALTVRENRRQRQRHQMRHDDRCVGSEYRRPDHHRRRRWRLRHHAEPVEQHRCGGRNQYQGLVLPGRSDREQERQRRYDVRDAGADAQRLPGRLRRTVERPDVSTDFVRALRWRLGNRPSPHCPATAAPAIHGWLRCGQTALESTRFCRTHSHGSESPACTPPSTSARATST